MSKRDERERKKEMLAKRREEREKKGREGSSGFKHLLSTEGRSFQFYNLKVGLNHMDIMSYEVSSDNHPDGYAIGEDDYKLMVWQHENIGVTNEKVLCLWKTFERKCPICEERGRLFDAGKNEEAKKLRPKLRVYYNVIDVSEDAETDEVQIFETSGAEGWFDDLLETESKAGREVIPFYDIEEGKTVICRCKEDEYKSRKFPKPQRVDFEDREPYDDSVYDEVFPLDAMLVVPTYEQVAKIFLELEDEDVEETKPTSTRKKKAETKEDEPVKSTRKRKRSEPEPKPKEDPEDEGSASDCPYGHIYGVDFQKTDACKECEEEVFEACGDKADEITEAEKEAEKEAPAKDKSTRRRRRK